MCLYTIGKVIYDFSFNFVILFISFVFIGLPIVWIFSYNETRKNEISEKLANKLFSVIFICIGVIFLIESIIEYQTIAHKYKTGQYQSVEGEVVAYHPQSSSGKNKEHFIVDEVYFSYHHADLSKPGYNGGKEIRNGQHLLIKYYTLSNGERVILYIEELE